MPLNANLIIALVGVGLLVLGCVLRRPIRNRFHLREARFARESFRLHREVLEARFLDLARSLGKPRGLTWRECQWGETVAFARERHGGLITAFAAVNISFDAVEGGDMEDVAAVSTIRDAAALFHYRAGHWGTGGRALFNMDPMDALDRLKDQYAPLES